MLKNYESCIFCNSKNLVLSKDQSFNKNFYVKYLTNDLKIKKNSLKKIKKYQCKKCKIFQNNPWFDKKTTKRIYSNIYGQHHRSWTNVIDYFNLGKFPNHGNLFNLLSNKLKIKTYAEFNSLFMGLFINFFDKEYKKNIYEKKKFSENVLQYLSSRQLAGKSKKQIKDAFKKSSDLLRKIDNFRKNKKNKVKKYMFIDNSEMFWSENDNYKSVNSRTYASEIFDLEVVDINSNFKIPNKIDLFGIFHSLDHTFNPKKILNFALNTSNYVIIYCHCDPKINKQHLFSLTEEFLNYLNKNKIFTINLTKRINKNFKSPELYFLCTKKKENLKKINALPKNQK